MEVYLQEEFLLAMVILYPLVLLIKPIMVALMKTPMDPMILRL